MHLSDSYYYYIEALLSISLIAFLKFSLVPTKADLLCFMPADSISHIPRLPFNTIINKHYYYISKHFILALIPIIISHLISTKENDLKILCQE